MQARATRFAEVFVERVVLANRAAFFAVVLAIALSGMSQYFLRVQNVFNLFDQAVIFTIVALSTSFVLAAGEVDLSIIGVVPLTGVVVAWLQVHAGWPMVPAIGAALLTGMLCGMANGALISTLRLPSFIVTLATGAVFQGIMYVITNFTPVTELPADFVNLGQGRVGPMSIPTLMVIPLIVVMVVMEKRTVFAQHVIAQANNPEAVRVAGVATSWLRFKLFTLQGLFVAFAGVVITARSASAQIGAGLNLMLLVIAAVVIGGTPVYGGRLMIIGTVFGCLTIGMINNGLDLIGLPSTFQTATQGIVILLALYIDSRTTQITNRIQKRVMRRELELTR